MLHSCTCVLCGASAVQSPGWFYLIIQLNHLLRLVTLRVCDNVTGLSSRRALSYPGGNRTLQCETQIDTPSQFCSSRLAYYLWLDQGLTSSV